MIFAERCINCYWDHNVNEIVVIDPTKFAQHYAHVTHPRLNDWIPNAQSTWTLKIYPKQVMQIV